MKPSNRIGCLGIIITGCASIAQLDSKVALVFGLSCIVLWWLTESICETIEDSKSKK